MSGRGGRGMMDAAAAGRAGSPPPSASAYVGSGPRESRVPESSRASEVAAAAGVDEAMYAAAVLIDELRNEDVQLRLGATRKVAVIARALGEERTRSELLPFLTESTDDDDEVLLALAQGLGQAMVPLVGGPEHAHALLAPLERLAKAEDSAVRDATVASLGAVARSLPRARLESHFLPLVRELAGHAWFTAKVAAAALLPVAVERAAPEARTDLVALYGTLSQDAMPAVRRAAARALPALAAALPDPGAVPALAAAAKRFSEDDQDSVRLLAVDGWAGLAPALGGASSSSSTSGGGGGGGVAGGSSEDVLSSVLRLARDASWRVRWAAADHMVDLSAALGAEATQRSLLPVFVTLLRDAEAEVRAAAASRLAAVAARVSVDAVRDELLPAARTLVGDESEPVRTALAKGLPALAPRLGPDPAIATLLPLLLSLLKDAASAVRLGVIAHLEAVDNVIGVGQLAESLLPAVTALAQDEQWRVRAAVLERMPDLGRQLGRDAFDGSLTPLCIAWLADDVASIRVAAADNLAQLANVFGQAWAREGAVAAVRDLAKETSYLIRTTALRAAAALADVMDADAVAADLLPPALALAADKVPNVRLVAAQTLGRMLPRLPPAHQARARDALGKLADDRDADVSHFAALELDHPAAGGEGMDT